MELGRSSLPSPDRDVEETATTAFTFLSSSFADTGPSLFSFLQQAGNISDLFQ